MLCCAVLYSIGFFASNRFGYSIPCLINYISHHTPSIFPETNCLEFIEHVNTCRLPLAKTYSIFQTSFFFHALD